MFNHTICPNCKYVLSGGVGSVESLKKNIADLERRLAEVEAERDEYKKCLEVYAEPRKWIPIALEGEGVVHEFIGNHEPAQECLRGKGGDAD